MKKEVTMQELLDYLEKKSSEIEGEAILAQMNRIDTSTNANMTEVLNKMYELGHSRGHIIGKRDALFDFATFLKILE
jgi:hypothetical protein